MRKKDRKKATTEKLRAFTRKDYDQVKANAETLGHTVQTKFRKGIKSIKLGPIVLGYSHLDCVATDGCKTSKETIETKTLT
jgi:hypothetical protein